METNEAKNTHTHSTEYPTVDSYYYNRIMTFFIGAIWTMGIVNISDKMWYP